MHYYLHYNHLQYVSSSSVFLYTKPLTIRDKIQPSSIVHAKSDKHGMNQNHVHD